MDDNNIRVLNDNVRSQIRSSISINSITQCVTELVLNSLDAKSTAIAIRINLATYHVQVVDNGKGITRTNLEHVGIRYMTDKCHSMSDLRKRARKMYGFRGEALASIAQLSKTLEVTTKSLDSTTYQKTISAAGHNSRIEALADKDRPSCGTTVSVHGFLHNIPVRQHRIKSCIDGGTDLDAIKTMLEHLIIIHPRVSFSLRNNINGTLLVNAQKQNDVMAAFKSIHPGIDVDQFVLMKVKKNRIAMECLVHKGLMMDTNRFQYIYVNKRPVFSAKIQKIIAELFLVRQRQQDVVVKKTSNSRRSRISKSYPVYVLMVQCPQIDVDLVSSSSLKLTVVEFRNFSIVNRCVVKMIRAFFGNEINDVPSSSPIDNNDKLISKSDCGVSQITGAVKGCGRRKRLNDDDDDDTKAKDDDNAVLQSKRLIFNHDESTIMTVNNDDDHANGAHIGNEQEPNHHCHNDVHNGDDNDDGNEITSPNHLLMPLQITPTKSTTNLIDHHLKDDRNEENEDEESKGKDIIMTMFIKSLHVYPSTGMMKKMILDERDKLISNHEQSPLLVDSRSDLSLNDILRINKNQPQRLIMTEDNDDDTEMMIIDDDKHIPLTNNDKTEPCRMVSKCVQTDDKDLMMMIGINHQFRNEHETINNDDNHEVMSLSSLQPDQCTFLIPPSNKKNMTTKDGGGLGLDHEPFFFAPKSSDDNNCEEQHDGFRFNSNLTFNNNFAADDQTPLIKNNNNYTSIRDDTFANFKNALCPNTTTTMSTNVLNVTTLQNIRLSPIRKNVPRTTKSFCRPKTIVPSSINSHVGLKSPYFQRRHSRRRSGFKNIMSLKKNMATDAIADTADILPAPITTSINDNLQQQQNGGNTSWFTTVFMTPSSKERHSNNSNHKSVAVENNNNTSRFFNCSSINNDNYTTTTRLSKILPLRQPFIATAAISSKFPAPLISNKMAAVLDRPQSPWVLMNHSSEMGHYDDTNNIDDNLALRLTAVNKNEGVNNVVCDGGDADNFLPNNEVYPRIITTTTTRPSGDDYDGVTEWLKQTNNLGNSYYMNQRTGMLSFLSPKHDIEYNLTTRFEFVPKGLSPVLVQRGCVEHELTSETKDRLKHAILESYENELLVVKWNGYIRNNDPNKFFDELYKDKAKSLLALNTLAVPNVNIKALPKSLAAMMANSHFQKDYFNGKNSITVIGQLDCKFIVAIVDKPIMKMLFLFDQHAVHERIRLEQLLQNYKDSSTELDQIVTIFLPHDNLILIQHHQQYLNSLGIDFKVFTHGINIGRLPACLCNKIKKDTNIGIILIENVIKEILQILRLNSCGGDGKVPVTGTGLPTSIQCVINSEACRGAIKFGDKLTKTECESYLVDLFQCNLPFQCAHGRPTLTPLLDLSNNVASIDLKPKFSKLYDFNNYGN